MDQAENTAALQFGGCLQHFGGEHPDINLGSLGAARSVILSGFSGFW